jgi:NTP pyrophosphatase (non-canonical NTP hydrolase)
MNLTEYTKRALTTESKPNAVVVSSAQLHTTLAALISAGNLLDILKKDCWYGLPTDQGKLLKRSTTLHTEIESLSNLNVRDMLPRPIPRDFDNLELPNPRLAHGIVGATTESIELLQALQKVLDGDTDGVNILEEVGDVMWYLAIIVDTLGGSWDAILQANIDKLARRNKVAETGGGFNAEATINRDTADERAILNGQLSG